MTTFSQTNHSGDSIAGLPCAGPITTFFGVKDELHPAGHAGLDIGAQAGVPIYAPAQGIVIDVFALPLKGNEWDAFKNIFGNCVILDHGDIYTLYAHMQSPPIVREGQQVAQGAQLGVVGQTGFANGPHLHWGVAKHDNRYFQFPPSGPVGVLLDPLDFLGIPAPAPVPTLGIDIETVNVGDIRIAIEQGALKLAEAHKLAGGDGRLIR